MISKNFSKYSPKQGLRSGETGFTLVETLIALAVFAIIAAASSGILTSAITTEDETSKVSARLQKLSAARSLMRSDFLQMVARPVRDPFGTPISFLFEGGFIRDKVTLVRFTRRGRINPGGRQRRGNLVNVSYLLLDGALVRRTWQRLDPAPDAKPVDQILLENVTAVSIRFLEQGTWKSVFEIPANTQETVDQQSFPAAIEVTLQTSDYGEIRQVFRGTGRRTL